MNEVSAAFGYLQVTAAAHGLHPKILGYGDRAWWPDGLGVKINALRTFVHSDAVVDQDIVAFVDAFDVMVFGGAAALSAKFHAMERDHNRSIFFNAEKACFPDFDDICTPDYPLGPYPHLWRHLNSGIIVGRVFAMKQMLRDPVDNVIKGSDQAFYQRYFRDFPDRVGLDTSCALVCATQGLGEEWGFDIQGSLAVNLITGASPVLVHFVSQGHWPYWDDGCPTTLINEVFRRLHPEAFERLFGRVVFSARIGGSHQSTLLALRGTGRDAYHMFMRSVLCFRCRMLALDDRECKYATAWASDMCLEPGILLASLAGLLGVTVLLVRSRLRRLSRAQACKVE